MKHGWNRTSNLKLLANSGTTFGIVVPPSSHQSLTTPDRSDTINTGNDVAAL